MMIKFCYSLAVIATLMITQVQAQQTAKMTSSGIGYLEYLPQGYNTNTNKYPVVISLHGIKEKGNTLADVSRVANVGLPKYVKYGQQYPFILISPQLKTSMSVWTGDYVMQVVNYVKTKLRIDESRIYLTGLSLGGYGVWKTIAAYPHVFASILPICSGGNALSSACKIATENVPVWTFHGDKDAVVSYQVSLKMVNAMNACTPKPSPLAKITIYPGLGHVIWDKVYKESTALNWMLGFRKGSSSSPAPSNQSPIVSAGSDKSLTLPTNSTYMQGTASDADGSIVSYQWTKVSGGTASMSGTTSSKLTVSNLASGTYYFRLTVKDDKGASKYDDVKVSVSSSSNISPTVSAGSDQTLYLPSKSITIVGRASDSDGTIASYKWTKVSGPSASLSNTTTSKLWAYNLVQGTYYFRLTVTDNKGATKSDDMVLRVNSSSSTASSSSSTNDAPIVSAGSDQTTSNRAITIVGSATDPDGAISSYKWTKISGGTVSLSNATTSKLWAYNLAAGTYYFRLTVTDNSGVSRYDDMKLTVQSSTAAIAPQTTLESTSTSTLEAR